MLVFIDESGDPGMNKKIGSSEYFIVTAVAFEDHEEATRCDERIDTLRQELRAGEFHFNSCLNLREYSEDAFCKKRPNLNIYISALLSKRQSSTETASNIRIRSTNMP